MADRMISQVKSYYEQIKEKFEELGTVTLNLEVDPQIKCLLAHNNDIGSVICTKERKCFSISRSQKPLKECHIFSFDAVEIQAPDYKKPVYTGVTYLQGDQVMLVDDNNERVILLNSSYQYIASFALTDFPWDVCVVDHQEVCVSLPFQKTLQFLCIASGSIKPTRTVQTRYECWGIASAVKAKVVVSGSCNNNGKHYWSLINSTGMEEKFHQFDCQCTPSITYHAVNSSCTNVYLTVFLANSLYCFDMDGKKMYTYSTDSLKGPRGVATDRDGNVYVAGGSSHNMHQLTPDGSPIRIITDGISQIPRAICFNNSLDRFLITSDTDSDSIKIYMFRS